MIIISPSCLTIIRPILTNIRPLVFKHLSVKKIIMDPKDLLVFYEEKHVSLFQVFSQALRFNFWMSTSQVKVKDVNTTIEK